ncbi:hypothetical protein SKAU_G00110640 [Synaphobranchus kaupii]|uniref:PGC-1 and ERR-induced regulator in muscle protein 1 n=1 Tax=Synaphobranchus kaupii TaxID=118154 RepID=A0A9Q1G0F4_SYNKA|nr:hypothetical protein SKAU_G00110640 [Synaphobranchus kaupii]
MDDFDYSVQISERDWDIFFQECEECDLLPPALAGADDSGASDADDTTSTSVLPRGSRVAEERDSPAIDEPPDRAGLPVERYLSARDLPRPEDVLSCSEEDSHLESINVFFERLRVTEGGGSFLVEARPKGTRQEVCALEEPSKKPAGLAQSQSYSNQRLTAKEDKVGGTLSTGRGGKDFDRAGKSIETESEEDEAFGPCEPTVELFIREEEWAVDEEWKQEREGELSKDKLLKAAPLGKTPSDDECGLGRKHTEGELQTSRLKNTDGTEHRPREGEMTSRAFLREAISLYGQQVDLQTDPEALICMGTAAGAENHTVKSAKKRKEHWLVPMEVGQDSSRAHISPSVRKKRKQLRDSPDPLVAGQGFEGLCGRSESETQVERFEREAAGQGEVASGRDGKACVVGNAQDPRGLPRDSGLMEASEAGDSGYSSHLEDSKLDQSSADVSTIIDFEEQCSLAHSAASVESSLEPKDTKTQGQRSPNARGVMWESELDPAGPGMNNDTNEMPTLYSGDSISPLLLSDKAQQGFRRMCKNISVQNLQALEVEPPVNQVTSTSLVTAAIEEKELYESSSSFQRPEENPSSVPLESDGRTSAVSSLSGGDVRVRHRTSFREIIKYLFGVGEPGVGQEDTTHTEEPAGDGGSVAEMYDYFFSEFEIGNFFLPLSQAMGNGKNEPVPVTSSSRYSNRNLQFPEAYDYFFPDDSSIESEDKGDGDHNQAPIRVVTCLNKDTSEPLGAVTTPDMYKHFFTNSDWRESLFWRNPLSLRRMRFKGLTGPREGSTSCVVVTAERQGRSVFSTICTESSVDFHGAVSPQTPLYCLEEQIFRELAEQQRQYTDLQTAIAVPNSPLLSLRQSDMCLLCIAFASWVLKTANPQDSDTWKAALLANISALSAIRYLRRYVIEEGDEP